MFYDVITAIDGYKADHRRQYPEGTRRVYSNWTPRGSRVEGQHEVVFFGLQYFLQRFLTEEMQRDFFDRPLDVVLYRYAARMKSYLGIDGGIAVGTDHIADLHRLGYLPLRYSALPEGTLSPLRVPQFVVENTVDDFFWLVNYYETLASSTVWMPCTSATTAYRFRSMLNRYADITGTPSEFVDWQGHDFSFRGLPGIEAASMSGAAHLLSFLGTDTIPALDFIMAYYWGEALPHDYQIGGTVFATEHSVMCAGGKEDEKATVDRLLELYPQGIVSVVSDTWDLWKVLTDILPSLKDKILARDGKLVIRPDSGDPVKIICGDPDARWGSPIHKGVIRLLWDTFGGTKTPTGWRMLDSHVGAIYGDAITFERGEEICLKLAEMGFASGNVVFGVGSFSYQYVTRDTYGNAMKATWAVVGDEERDLFKRPVTDNGEKFSATGRLAVVDDEETGLMVIQRATAEQEARSLLRPIWCDGQFLERTSISEIRERLWPK